MYKLFITDFVKNKVVLLLVGLALLAELATVQSIHNSLLLFCLPYGMSIILNYLMNYRPLRRPSAKISAQFKPQPIQRVKIMPK